MDENAWRQWFEQLWTAREEDIYPRLFATAAARHYAMTPGAFTGLGVDQPDERFLTHSVLEFPPTPTPPRPHIVLATSGMSNPWGEHPDNINPKNYSGLGFEFSLHVPTEPDVQWGVRLLQWLMAVQLSVATGDVEGQLLEPLDVVPLGGALDGGGESGLTHAWVLPPPDPEEFPAFGYAPRFILASGQVDMLMMLGITTREADFLRSQGAEALLTLLRHHEVYPVTNPRRVSVV